MLYSRYLGFTQNLSNSKKDLLRLLFNACSSNLNTVTGQNIFYLKKKLQCNTLALLWDAKLTIRRTKVYSLTNDQQWKIEVLKELGRAKNGLVEIDFDENHLNLILDHVCLD